MACTSLRSSLASLVVVLASVRLTSGRPLSISHPGRSPQSLSNGRRRGDALRRIRTAVKWDGSRPLPPTRASHGGPTNSTTRSPTVRSSSTASSLLGTSRAAYRRSSTSPTVPATPASGRPRPPPAPRRSDGEIYVIVGPNGETAFSPESTTIELGDTVECVWDSDDHNVRPSRISDEWSSTPAGELLGTVPLCCSYVLTPNHQSLPPSDSMGGV